MKRRTTYDALRAASEITGFRTVDITAKQRSRGDIYDVRLAVAIAARDHLGKSFETIGYALKRHHTSVLDYVVGNRERPEIKELVGQIVMHLERPTFTERLAEKKVPFYA